LTLLLAIPNVSEGRDDTAIGAISGAFGDLLLDVHRDHDHHRSVFTLAGAPGSLAPAVLAGAREALERALETLRRESGSACSVTLAELVDAYLAQHDVAPVTLEKLRWLLAKAVRVFGVRRPAPVGASLAGDRGLADDDPARSPLRGHAGASAGADPSGRVGDDRRQPGQAGRR
jgi:hypothetical protein